MSRPRQSKAAAGGAMKSLGAASRNNKDGFPIPLQFLYRDPRNVMLKRRGTDPEIDAEDGSNGGRMQERQREQRTLFAASMAAGRASFGQHRWTDAKRSFTKVKTQIRPRRLFFSFALMLDASGSSTRRPSPSYVKDERKPSVYVSGERVVWCGGGGGGGGGAVQWICFHGTPEVDANRRLESRSRIQVVFTQCSKRPERKERKTNKQNWQLRPPFKSCDRSIELSRRRGE